MLQESGEMNAGARNSHPDWSIVPSVNSARICTYTKATQTLILLSWERRPSLCGRLVLTML